LELKLYNTLTKKIELFQAPITQPIKLYGIDALVGINPRMFVLEYILAQTLQFAGYTVIKAEFLEPGAVSIFYGDVSQIKHFLNLKYDDCLGMFCERIVFTKETDQFRLNKTSLPFKYLCLSAHYRAQMSIDDFDKVMDTVQSGFDTLNTLVKEAVGTVKSPAALVGVMADVESGYHKPRTAKGKSFLSSFLSSIYDDLNTPRALSVMFEMLNSELDPVEKVMLTCIFDKIIGLNLLQDVDTRLEV
jgi:hypothetical protein